MVLKMKFRKKKFTRNHTEINSDDWAMRKQTTRTIKHEKKIQLKIRKLIAPQPRSGLNFTKLGGYG